MKSYILNQRTLDFNVNALEASGWEATQHKNHIFDWTEYEKKWAIQDEEGGAYHVTVSLRQHENIGLVYVNGQWVGRALYVAEANSIANSIKKHAR